MAISTSGRRWVFDATTQVSPTTAKAYIKGFTLITAGTAGDFTILEAAGGREVLPATALGVDDHTYLPFGERTDLYIQAIPTGGKLIAHIGEW